MLLTWLAIFPLVSIGTIAMAPFTAEWNLVARSFVLTALVVPTAVYLVVPQLLHAYGAIASRARR